MQSQPFQNLDRAKEKKLEVAPLRNGEKPRSNTHLQNPTLHKDATSELQTKPLTVLNNLLRKDKTDASRQSYLQFPHNVLHCTHRKRSTSPWMIDYGGLVLRAR